MLFPRLRPRIETTVATPPADLARRVDALLTDRSCPCRGFATSQQIELHIAAGQRRFFSPQLLVNLTDRGDATELTGHFGPNGNVWTMFLAAYGFVTLSGVTGLFLGVSQRIAREPAWGLWLVPAALALIALIYAAAGFGQRLGRRQVHILHEFLESAIEDACATNRPSGRTHQENPE